MTPTATMNFAQTTRVCLTQSNAGWTAVTDGRVDDRLGNASQVQGQHEGRPFSRWPSSAETIGDPALSRDHALVGASAPMGHH